MSTSADIFQVIIRFISRSSSRLIDGKSDSALGMRVGLCSIYIITFEMLGMDGTVGIRVIRVPSKTSAHEHCKSNLHILHVEECMLHAIIASAPEVRGSKVGRLQLAQPSVEGALLQGVSPDIMLLLLLLSTKEGRNVRWGGATPRA